MRSPHASAVLLMLVCAGAPALGVSAMAAREDPEKKPVTLAELWSDPGSEPRDLFWGSGGRAFAPNPDATFDLLAKDDAGFSVSYDVKGPDGVEWSAKVGPEAQTEVVMSRLLWGLGYHQPPLYYLPSWTLDRGRDGLKRETEARFRPKLKHLSRAGFWKWADNPFQERRELRGLLVVLLLLNSTDLKDDNNSIYDVKAEAATSEHVGRWFLVRDLGAALGETGKLYPRRNWLEGFERSRFLLAASEQGVEFDYNGRHRDVIASIQPQDVRWAAERLHRLTERQWRDAFRAGNYAEPITTRYLRLIEHRIAQGMALRVDVDAGKR